MSFRDGPKDQTRNLEIPGSMLTHRPGMTAKRLHPYFFRYFAKNARLRGQAMSALALS